MQILHMGVFEHILSGCCVSYEGTYKYEIPKFLCSDALGITCLAKVEIDNALGCLDGDVYVAVKEFFMKYINKRK